MVRVSTYYPSHIMGPGGSPPLLGTISDLSAVAGNEQVTLSWSSAANATSHQPQYKEASSGTWLDFGSALGASATGVTVTGLDNDTLYDFRVVASDGATTTISNTEEATPEAEPLTPYVIDNIFDEGVSDLWTGSLGGGEMSIISDPTGSFGGRQVAQFEYVIDSASHTDQDIYYYYEGYDDPEVYVAIDVEFTNVVVPSAQRKLIYLKGDRGYSGYGSSWTLILTAYISNLRLGGDTHGGSDFNDNIAPGVLAVDTPYRIEFGVRVNDPGEANGWVRIWLTNLDEGPGDRTLVYEDLDRVIDSTTGVTHDPYPDRIQIGDQLDNGGHEGTLVADDRIFDRMIISSQEIGTYGLVSPAVLATTDFNNDSYGDFTTQGSPTYGQREIIDDPTGAGYGKVLHLIFLDPPTGSSDVETYLQWVPPGGSPIGVGDTVFSHGRFYIEDIGYMSNRKLWRYYVGPQGGAGSDVVVWMGDTLRVEGVDGNRDFVWLNTEATTNHSTWYELEVQQTFESSIGAADGIFRVWLDGELVYENTAFSFLNATYQNLASIRIGYQTQSTREIPSLDDHYYWTDMTVSTERIGEESPGYTDDFSDDFEATGGNGPLEGWLTFNPSALPDVARRDGYYDSGEIDGGDGTSWHDAGRGRADWKLQSLPGAGEPDKVYIFHNVGLGPADTPQDNLALSAPMYNFCGVVVHIADLETPSYEFCVMGHRDTVRACLESKTNTNGDSNTGNTAADVIGEGVTHCDIRVTTRSDGTIRWAYRAVGAGSWTPLFGTGITNGGGLNFGSECYIGLVTYTSGGTREPIRGTCAAVELVAEGS